MFFLVIETLKQLQNFNVAARLISCLSVTGLRLKKNVNPGTIIIWTQNTKNFITTKNFIPDLCGRLNIKSNQQSVLIDICIIMVS